MAFEKQHEPPEAPTDAICIHLRNKAMYVTGDMRPPREVVEEHSGHCWCNITQHVVGPDRKGVDPIDCAAGRDCYQISR